MPIVALAAVATVLVNQWPAAEPAEATATGVAHGEHGSAGDGGGDAVPDGTASDAATTPGATADPADPLVDAGDDTADTDAGASESPAPPVAGTSEGAAITVEEPDVPQSDSPLVASTGTTLAQAAGEPAGEERRGAEGLGAPRGAVDPSEVLSSAASLGGCHPAYGEAGECLPIVPPSMAEHAAEMVAAGMDLDSMPHPWSCAELLQLFPDGIAVRDAQPPNRSTRSASIPTATASPAPPPDDPRAVRLDWRRRPAPEVPAPPSSTPDSAPHRPAPLGARLPPARVHPRAPARALQRPLIPAPRKESPMAVTSLALTAVALTLLVLALSTLVMATYAWWDPGARSRTAFPTAPGEASLTFSVIVPCRHEREEVVRATVGRLLAQTHRRLEIIISVGHDDPDTRATAERLRAEHPHHVRVSVDRALHKSKPHQLNTALRMCRGDVVGVFDAESLAAPDLLRSVDGAFRATGADAVQGAVQLVNHRDSWFALRNCLEYFIWFSSRLHLQERVGFIPLGGTTVFVRRELLVALGGWDARCLAEDCELGVRLSSLGHRVRVAYCPELATREETPGDVTAFVKQRTRWALGFFQVLRKGVWRQLPTRGARLAARWTLVQQHLVAITGILVPVSVGLAIWGAVPLGVALLTFVPLAVTVATVAMEACMLRELGRDHGLRLGVRDYLVLVVTTVPFQLLLAYATIRAYVRFRRGDLTWEKTAHAGRHLTPEQTAVAA
ncbi:glycosyltransferase [Litorihabitans aurantiacus]|uniref:glycosyltransferase n=1 Tax=Litorihabitans aurantiacus TaxID=1930061 RepID=UPI0024E136D0|nr:glycosyltransferase [Litorihabitans aurantiacus]